MNPEITRTSAFLLALGSKDSLCFVRLLFFSVTNPNALPAHRTGFELVAGLGPFDSGQAGQR
jgi:hypothetical protein